MTDVQRVGELFLGTLIRSPLSSFHRRPSDDLYNLELHESYVVDGTEEDEGDEDRQARRANPRRDRGAVRGKLQASEL